jgi:hypothetical protein
MPDGTLMSHNPLLLSKDQRALGLSGNLTFQVITRLKDLPFKLTTRGTFLLLLSVVELTVVQ